MEDFEKAFKEAIAEWEANGKFGGEFEAINIREAFEFEAKKAGFSDEEIGNAFNI